VRDRQRKFWLCAGGYLAVVAVAAVITGPTIVRGADGLEIGALLLLGLPCSVVLMFVGGWSLLPFGDTAANWGGLVGLIAGSVANTALAYRIWGRRPADTRAR
jgi:hypothetical protein